MMYSTHEREVLLSEKISPRAKNVLAKIDTYDPKVVALTMSKKRLKAIPGCGEDTASEIQGWVMKKGYYLQSDDLDGIPLEKLEQQRELYERELAHIVARIAVLRQQGEEF